jgi:hypothetical protein
MKRRDVLRLGAALPLAVATRRARSQTKTITRAAVVIGVDQPSKLPPLDGAASGAVSVSDWLKAEGFEVKLFTDEDQTKPVKAGDLFDAIDGLVNLGTLQQLVVYFAGHGCFVGTGEYWLLSQALHNPNEAVSISQCFDRARLCGIPNVVFISDACRSTSASLGIQELSGYVIFPTINNTKVFTYLDRFLATRVGAPAYEVKDAAGKYSGIYTSCLLDAYSNPDDSMTAEVGGIRVVPNKKLEKYLLSEVPKKAEISNALEYPDSQVTSDSYIGRAETTAVGPSPHHWRGCGGCRGCRGCGGAGRPTIVSVPLTIKDLSDFELNQVGLKFVRSAAAAGRPNSAFQLLARDTGFAATRDSIASAHAADISRFDTGISVFGTKLRRVIGSGIKAEIARAGDGSRDPAIVPINPADWRQANVALEFDDGSGTIVAVLRHFVARVVVEKGAVVSVSYAPARAGGRRDAPASDDQRDKLHAVVATSAKFGVFRIDGPPDIRNQNARQLTNAISVHQPFDPTLALYGAYAYADAGLYEQVRAVHEKMKLQFGISLFDIAMLASTSGEGSAPVDVAPASPVLSAGWQFLAAKYRKLPEKLARVQSHVVPALWTTFDREGMSNAESLL